MRIGVGYDVHRLAEGRRLILGGVEIPYRLGLLGHSNADVLVHAIIDAILGAAGQGDIGRHFPDADARYEGVCSMKLLAESFRIIKALGYSVGNIDAVIVAQAPRLMPYLDSMSENIADCLCIEPGCVNVKATTEEGLGFTGAGEGIAAHAVCLLLSS